MRFPSARRRRATPAPSTSKGRSFCLHRASRRTNKERRASGVRMGLAAPSTRCRRSPLVAPQPFQTVHRAGWRARALPPGRGARVAGALLLVRRDSAPLDHGVFAAVDVVSVSDTLQVVVLQSTVH